MNSGLNHSSQVPVAICSVGAVLMDCYMYFLQCLLELKCVYSFAEHPQGARERIAELGWFQLQMQQCRE